MQLKGIAGVGVGVGKGEGVGGPGVDVGGRGVLVGNPGVCVGAIGRQIQLPVQVGYEPQLFEYSCDPGGQAHTQVPEEELDIHAPGKLPGGGADCWQTTLLKVFKFTPKKFSMTPRIAQVEKTITSPIRPAVIWLLEDSILALSPLEVIHLIPPRITIKKNANEATISRK
jgi:hypothetical protein